MIDSVELIFKYFERLSDIQIEQYTRLFEIYVSWNRNINVISRKDMDHFYERHVLHSLAIARVVDLQDGDKIMDLGTGGGFPGIPLAILCPGVEFTLVDSIGKKIKVVEAAVKELNLQNVKALNVRAETLSTPFDYVVSRATAPLADLVKWTAHLNQKGRPSHLIALKGGNLTEELKEFSKKVVVTDISDFYKEEFFETKKIISMIL